MTKIYFKVFCVQKQKDLLNKVKISNNNFKTYIEHFHKNLNIYLQNLNKNGEL